MPNATLSLDAVTAPDERAGRRVDRLGLLLVVIGGLGVAFLPFLVSKANRIAAGNPLGMFASMPVAAASALAAVLVAVAAVAIFIEQRRVRVWAGIAGLLALALAAGYGAQWLTPAADRYARISPGGASWILLVVTALLVTDGLARLRLGPLARIGALALAVAVVAAILASGAWDALSFMREYASRATMFWAEARRHVALSLGALGAAVAVGLPLGIACHRVPAIRAPILQALNLVQTIPSIALFGIFMAPLGYLAATFPLASALGIRGIGAAPALVALFLYALLPVVTNTVIGLAQVSPAAVDAARGMGLTGRQVLGQVELPLAFPVILTGIRIVLVQSIGLVTIAALIGGGGFGTFVFQGIGQTAMDLVLLGAAPTVALAFAAAVLLDAAVDLTKRSPA